MSDTAARAGAAPGLRVAVVGGGWAGLSAAVAACGAGHRVVVFEAARTLGGRARTVPVARDGLGDGDDDLLLDNGQHILIGAYAETLALMRRVGVAPETVLARLPLSLVFPDGGGLRMPDLPAPWNVLLGVLGARGWEWADRWSLIRTALDWRRRNFTCPPDATVGQLCARIRPRVMAQLIEPLCVSALNTPADRACGTVFLRVLRDALFGPRGSADLLLPRTDLGALLPAPAADWLQARGARIETGRRIATLADAPEGCWRVDDELFDRVVLACPPGEAQRLLSGLLQQDAADLLQGWSGHRAAEGGGRLAERTASYRGTPWRATAQHWLEAASRLRFEAIATVYLRPAAPRAPGGQDRAPAAADPKAAAAAMAEAPVVAEVPAAADAAAAADTAARAHFESGDVAAAAPPDSPGAEDAAPGTDDRRVAAPPAEPTAAGDAPAADGAATAVSTAAAAAAAATADADASATAAVPAPLASAGPDPADPPDGVAASAPDAAPADAGRSADAGEGGEDVPQDAGAVPRLSAPMLALHATPDAPAQFVFDRGQLDGPAGLLAFVVSASAGEREWIAARVLRQAADQLGLDGARLAVLKTVVEKRATFACTPGLARPGLRIAPGLVACGDYVDGPYPATLEGAVRSGRQAAALL